MNKLHFAVISKFNKHKKRSETRLKKVFIRYTRWFSVCSKANSCRSSKKRDENVWW